MKYFKKFFYFFVLVFILNSVSFVSADEVPVEPLPVEVDPLPITPIISPVPILPDPVSINLKIYAGDEILFDQAIKVSACPQSPEIDSPMVVSLKCAIEQSGLSNTWTWYDTNFQKESELPKTLGTLDELGGNSSDNAKYLYWTWFSDLNYGTVALNNHLLKDGESILLTYNAHPLRISTSGSEGTIGDSLTFKAEEKTNFNEDWSDLIWTPLSDVKIYLGDQSCQTLEGSCSIILNKAGSFEVIGSKSLYVPSNVLKITVSDINNSKEEGSSSSHQETKTFSISQALSFLSLKEKSDGSFGSSLYTDWVAIGIAQIGSAGNNLKSQLKNILVSQKFEGNAITDSERQAMALMALGINPYNGTTLNYIDKIVSSFDGTQIGDASLYNDDIFGLMVLSHAGYNQNDLIIKKVISFILSKQSTDGSWGSVDLTAAAIQSLNNFKNVDGVKSALSNGQTFLLSKQNPDGGFDNSSSTSWAIQALALDTSFSNQINQAVNYLTEKQNLDGGMEGSDDDSRIWTTAYTLPAILKISWNDILGDFSKEEVENLKTTPPIVKNDTQGEEKKEILDLPTVLEKKDPIKITSPLKIKNIIVKDKKNILVKKENSKIISFPQSALLQASALQAGGENSHFWPNFSGLFNKMKAPFLWLWLHLVF